VINAGARLLGALNRMDFRVMNLMRFGLNQMCFSACAYAAETEPLQSKLSRVVSLKSKTGNTVIYILTTASLVKSVNQSVALITTCTAQVFRELGVL